MPRDPTAHFSEHADRFAAEYALDELPDAYHDLLETFVAMVESGRVLDAGCGTGKDTDYFTAQGLDAVGVDAATGMVAHAREHHRGDFRVMDVRELAFDDGSFDGVWCNTVLQFFPPAEMPAVVAELVRVLRSGGVLYTTFKLGEGNVVREQYGDRVQRHRVPEQRARAMVQEVGLTIVETRTAELNEMTVFNVFCEKRA